MRSLKLATLIFATAVFASCSSNSTEDIQDKTNSPQDSPVEYPKPKGEWIEARTFMMQEEDGTGCAQVDFRVMANSGVYSVNECDKTKSGQLTADEFTRLDNLTTQAYKRTEGAVCPEIFRFNKFYATINATNDEFDRNFDPDTSCYRGDEAVVNSYKTYLRQLLNKYRGDSENSELVN